MARGTWIRRFELAPAGASSIPALDGLRALAVIAIFLRHSWGLSGQARVVLPIPFTSGDIDLSPLVVMMSNGVDLFFVLSGFLLARSFVAADLEGRPRPSLRRYARTRAYRILPAYWFALAGLMLFFAPLLLSSPEVYSKVGVATFASHAVVLQTANPLSYGRWSIASPYWTLTIEVLFYAVLPFVVAAFYRRRALVGLAASAVVSFVWLWLARDQLGWLVDAVVDVSRRSGASPEFARFFLSKQVIAFALSFGAGIAAASLFERGQRAEGRPPWWAGPAFGRLCLAAGVAATLAAMTWLGRRSLRDSYYDGIVLMSSGSRSATAFYYLESTSMAVAFGLVLYGVALLRNGRLTSVLRRPGLRVVGILGFAIYLWHMPFLYLYNRIEPIFSLPPGWHWLWLTVAAGAATLAVGLVSFFLVEKPWIERGRARPPATVQSPLAASPPGEGTGQ